MEKLSALGLSVHGFGFKTRGLIKAGRVMTSADSLAWSLAARMEGPLPGHDVPGPGRPQGHQTCSNCPVFALLWRKELLQRLKEAGVPLTAPSKAAFAPVAPKPVKTPKVEPVKPPRKEKAVPWAGEIKWFL